MDLNQIVLHTQHPLVIKNRSNCNLLSWSIQDWIEALGDDLLEFRCGKYAYTKEPQWDSTCTKKQSNFKDFLTQPTPNEWWYFDYKHLCQWFTNNTKLRHNIDWSNLGFPQLKPDDCTIWIGSQGAHTPCHQDTYGINMVLQVLGKKMWILMPPDSLNLSPTRIPFEESSIYSKLNFFSPNLQDFTNIKGCFKVILEPGDVLVVPHKWWHYVENLECSISVNAWLPGPQDDFERVKESIATILVQKFALENIILDPSALINSEEAMKIIQAYNNNKPKSVINKPNIDFNKCKDVFPVQWMNKIDFERFIKKQIERFELTSANCQSNDVGLISLLDAMLSDDVLNLIANKLIKK